MHGETLYKGNFWSLETEVSKLRMKCLFNSKYITCTLYSLHFFTVFFFSPLTQHYIVRVMSYHLSPECLCCHQSQHSDCQWHSFFFISSLPCTLRLFVNFSEPWFPYVWDNENLRLVSSSCLYLVSFLWCMCNIFHILIDVIRWVIVFYRN